jgi:hypothetical protein
MNIPFLLRLNLLLGKIMSKSVERDDVEMDDDDEEFEDDMDKMFYGAGLVNVGEEVHDASKKQCHSSEVRS